MSWMSQCEGRINLGPPLHIQNVGFKVSALITRISGTRSNSEPVFHIRALYPWAHVIILKLLFTYIVILGSYRFQRHECEGEAFFLGFDLHVRVAGCTVWKLMRKIRESGKSFPYQILHILGTFLNINSCGLFNIKHSHYYSALYACKICSLRPREEHRLKKWERTVSKINYMGLNEKSGCKELHHPIQVYHLFISVLTQQPKSH
jgi:hypothetical protein